jgi:hypothetical protein
MGRLFGSLFVLLLVFSTAVSFISDGVYADLWWVSVIGVGILVVFAGLGGALVPPARKALAAEETKSGTALQGAFGALLGAEFFTMALFCWIIGNRTLSANNAYQALGLLIFLGLIGVGIQGALGAISWYVYVHNRSRVEGSHAG